MHRVVHAASSQVAVLAPGLDASAGHEASAGQDLCLPENWVHALFAGHGPAGCQLLDQLSHGYAGPPAAMSFAPVAPPSAMPLPAWQVPHGVDIAAFFDPRAPPLHLLSRA